MSRGTKKVRQGARKLFDLPLCAVAVGVYDCETLEEDGSNLFGLSEVDIPAIYLLRGQGLEHKIQILIHESCHVILHLSGVTYMLAQFIDEKLADHVEENMIRTLTPHITALVRPMLTPRILKALS